MAIKQESVRLAITTPFGPDKVWVLRVYGEESISGLFHFTCDCQSADKALDFTKIMGKHATVRLKMQNKKERFIDGVVTRFTQGQTGEKLTRYSIELRPWLWQLTLTQDSRIFQEKTVPKIIEQIFKDGGFTDFKNQLQGTYKPRVYCVQYQETAFDFVSRLMEEEGIFYFFKHEKGKHTLILADKPTAHADFPQGAKFVYRPDTHETMHDEDAVVRCDLEEQMASNSFTAVDFNMETPSTKLETTAKGKKGKMEVREFPSFFDKKADATAVAKRRIEEREIGVKEIRGTTSSRCFTTGFAFTITKHPRADLNAKWVPRWIAHNADLQRYKCDFRAFPHAAPFRPPRLTRKPVIVGTQTAIVVGKKGEEIFTDKFGRIKVHFHWDRLGKKDEKDSCWVRVAQGWAGKRWGGVFIPRIGMEVIVSFTEGDPDRPLVSGAVYNAENTLPYDLPAKATQSTIKTNTTPKGGGFNEIRFEDKKNKEEIFIHAQKDLKVKVLQDVFRETLRDEKITIKNSRTVTIKVKDDLLTLDKGNRKVEIKKGNDVLLVKGTRDVQITKDETHKNAKNFTHKVTKDYVLNVDGNLKITVKGEIIINGKKDIKIDSGMNLITKAKMNAKHEALAMDFKAKTKFAVKGIQVELKGVMVKVDGSAMIKLKAAMFDAKGAAMAKVEGGGMLMLKGGLAKIN